MLPTTTELCLGSQDEVLERPLVVDVPAASEEGQRFVFEQKPGEASGDDTGPVVVAITQLPHALYKRMPGSYDIMHTARVPIVRALCGTTLALKALDGGPSLQRPPALISRRFSSSVAHWPIGTQGGT